MYLKNKELLQDRSAPDTTSSGEKPPFARSPENATGQGAPDAQGRSKLDDQNIPTPGE